MGAHRSLRLSLRVLVRGVSLRELRRVPHAPAGRAPGTSHRDGGLALSDRPRLILEPGQATPGAYIPECSECGASLNCVIVSKAAILATCADCAERMGWKVKLDG